MGIGWGNCQLGFPLATNTLFVLNTFRALYSLDLFMSLMDSMLRLRIGMRVVVILFVSLRSSLVFIG